MFLSPVQILNYLPISSGSKVGDFGTGAGHYTLAVLEKFGPEVTIYALDSFHPALDKVAKEASRYGSKIYGLTANFNEHVPLKDNLLSAGIVANVLHAIEGRERFAKEVARVIAPGGNVLVVDWVSSFKNMGPPEDKTLTPGDAARLFQNAGFSIGNMLPAGTHHYAFIATLPR